MSVAKSYQNCALLCEPYYKDKNRMYVKIDFHGREKEVRWYDDGSTGELNAREAFGFCDAGYITIFQGSLSRIDEFFTENIHLRLVRFNNIFRWFCPSWLPVPELPDYIKPYRLAWDEVKETDTKMRDYSVVNKEVMLKIIGG